MAFVHLRTHTEFSVADGTLRIDAAIRAAAADGQAALAITDLSNLFGAIKLYSGARKKGVKPIIGADLWVEPVGGEKAPSRLVLLVQDRQGYLNLCELLSKSFLTNQGKGRAEIRREWLQGQPVQRQRFGYDRTKLRCASRKGHATPRYSCFRLILSRRSLPYE